MRPERLVLQAFGPYREQEVVDFAELGPNRVFLIHGDTGAGKTTILDAMVFALYGDTSGGERHAEQMRCDSAPGTLPTEVVFDFGLGERSYRIRRRPAQEITGARSGGALVSKPAEVVLWDRTGCASQEEGRPLATKIRDVEGRVRDLLGFSCEQFRQVVVLPQGRFRELLSSGSDKREEILRQLFRTERFRELEVKLADRAKQVRRDMEQLDLRRRAQLDLVPAEDDAELGVITKTAEEALAARMAEIEDADALARSLQSDLQTARQAAEAFQALAGARAHLDEVETRREAVDGQRKRVAAALRADEVRPLAAALAEVGTRLDGALAEQSGAGAALVAARDREMAAAGRLAADNERQPERLAAEDAIRELERQEVALAGWREAVSLRNREGERLQEAEEAAATAANGAAAAAQEVAELDVLKDAGQRAAVRLEVSRERMDRARRTEEQCRHLADLRARRHGVEIEHDALLERESLSLVARVEAEEHTRIMEEEWRAGRAAALAATLVPGQPCPVCGSDHHPAPAGGDGGGVADGDLEGARAEAVKAREAYERDRDRSAEARQRLTALQGEEKALAGEAGGTAEVTLEQACLDVESLVAEVRALEIDVHAGEVAERLVAATRRRNEAAEAKEAADATCAAAAQDLARAEERLSERSRGVRPELTPEGALEGALTEARHAAEVLRVALADAVEEAGAAKEERIALQAAVEAATAAAAAAAAQEATARETLEAGIGARSFADESDWRAQLLEEAERLDLEREIAAYQDELQMARGRLQQAETALGGRRPPEDLQLLQTLADGARERLDIAMSAHADAKASLGKLGEVRANLERLDEESDAVRAAYGVVGMLADAAGGQNASRVSFQRWVLGVYLDEVLATAGCKLYAMSKGRYRFEREREAQSRRRPSGLDIAVFDEFSGSARPAVTLSGGESFLAALALALGLAETVQEYAAGTPLETIFVDEGFGALDPDALELAVDTLMELQMSGRLVGVISHVAELRQVIPARLEVRGGSAGSSARFIVP